jgi:hypothetical protein
LPRTSFRYFPISNLVSLAFCRSCAKSVIQLIESLFFQQQKKNQEFKMSSGRGCFNCGGCASCFVLLCPSPNVHVAELSLACS